MSDIRVVFIPDGIRQVGDSQQTAVELGAVAEAIAERVQVPNHLTVRHRFGVGPKGAFAQVQMFGPGAIAWEFGSRRSPAHAPLRKAARA